MRKHVLIIPDGAADLNCDGGRTPLESAHIPAMDCISRQGVCGLMQTQYPDLPRGSMVAQLGMLGWDPRVYCPAGRASAELLGSTGRRLAPGDLAFRANLARMEGPVLESYNAGLISSTVARGLVLKLSSLLSNEFTGFELYSHSDFRTTLVVREAAVDPELLGCPEPHESEGQEFDLSRWVRPLHPKAAAVANRINAFTVAVAELLRGESANALLPWSPSGPFHLPAFRQRMHFSGPTAIVGFMDFLMGIATAGEIERVQAGNGRLDTDYAAKGRAVINLLEADYVLVVCHINAPDEASHMVDVEGKIWSLEQIDRYIVAPVLEYFERHPEQLGGVMVAPDHYTNTLPRDGKVKRSEVHSLEPVPFALLNGHEYDNCVRFSEAEAAQGKYGQSPVSHLDLLSLLRGTRSVVAGEQR